VKYLVRHGADVNMAALGMHRTAVWAAARYGHLEIVKFLAEHGADILIPDLMMKTPAQIAKISNNVDVAEYLNSRMPSVTEMLFKTMTKSDTWLSLGCGFILAILLVCVKTWFLKRSAESPGFLTVPVSSAEIKTKVTKGALRLAAKSTSRSQHCGTVMVMCRKLFRTIEVSAGVLTLGGVFSYIVNPAITFAVVLLFFMAPAMFAFGAKDVLGTPILGFAASTHASHALSCLVATTLALILRHLMQQAEEHIAPPMMRNNAVYNAQNENVFFEPFAWNHAARVNVLGYSLGVVNMGEAFRGLCTVEYYCLWLYAGVAGLACLWQMIRIACCGKGQSLDSDLEEKWRLAEQITLASQSSNPHSELVALGVKPEGPFFMLQGGIGQLGHHIGVRLRRRRVFRRGHGDRDVAFRQLPYGLLHDGNLKRVPPAGVV